MSDATDDLVDVIAEALKGHNEVSFDLTIPRRYTQHGGWNEMCGCGVVIDDGGSPVPLSERHESHRARAVAAALVDVYGEPEIEHDPLMVHPMDLRPKNYLRRLVFPWKAVKEEDEE